MLDFTAALLGAATTVGALYCAQKWEKRQPRVIRRALKGTKAFTSGLSYVSELKDSDVMLLLTLAAHYKANRKLWKKAVPKPFVAGLLFYEPSTRTRCSFQSAVNRLGGQAIVVDNAQSSSISKGESLEDTARMMSSYCDVLIVRHPEKGAPSRVREAIHDSVPVLNGGDGAGEHPSQALLDLFTIHTEASRPLQLLSDGKVDEIPLQVTFVGDLKYGRTVHSLAILLSRFNVVMSFVAQGDLALPQNVAAEINATPLPNGTPRIKSCKSLKEAVQTTDVLYVTRIQKERLQEGEYAGTGRDYCISVEFLDRHCEKPTIVLHPLPRVDELSTDVDDTAYCKYFTQAENGVYIRMALLSLTIGARQSQYQ